MSLFQRLETKQTQTVVMTPQLQQAIKLLQLSNIELTGFVEQELERNPLLERGEAESDPVPTGVDAPEPSAPEPPAVQDTLDQLATDSLTSGTDSPLDADSRDIYVDDGPADAWNADGSHGAAGEGDSGLTLGDWGSLGGSGGRTDFGEDDRSLEATLSDEPSLREHLSEQLNLAFEQPAQRLIGLHLIDMLDESGYLREDSASLAEMLGCTTEEVQAVLSRLQRFDPPGLFARNLSECLALQLADRNRLDPAMQMLLNHLDLLGKRDAEALMKLCRVDAEDLAEMVSEIRALDPKPALAWGHEAASPVTPDILMRAQPGGGWLLELNPDTLPRVLVNTSFYSRISRGVREKAEKEYLSECLASANWLVKSLQQRATTILKVATEIVQQQDAFFRHGVSHLKPLVLRDIAENIGMHESTVSRVTSNKFLASPRGIFELKYFFTASIGGTQAHSAEAVRHRIKSLIDAESPKAVLSDEKIVSILQGEGIDIARRTVAKYRESMKIPSSSQRKRQKSAKL